MSDATSGRAGGDTEVDRLREMLALADAELQRYAVSLGKLQGELQASRLEVAGARGETVQFKGFLNQAQAEAEAAHAHIEELRLHAAQLEIVLKQREALLQAQRAEIVALHASTSWRLTRPLRGAIYIARGVSRRFRAFYRSEPEIQQVGQVPPAPPGSQDPNSAYIFKPNPSADKGSTVTLDELFELSRSL